MRPQWIAALLAAFAAPALAAPCYVIYDRNDVVIFRDYTPPFDLSIANGPERAMMRQQKQHLLIAEFEQCNPVGFISPVTGGTTATVEEIVAQLQPAVATSVGGNAGAAYSSPRPGMRPVSPAPTATAAPPAATKRN